MLRQSAHMYKPRGEGWEVGERVKGKEGRDGKRWRGEGGVTRDAPVTDEEHGAAADAVDTDRDLKKMMMVMMVMMMMKKG